MTAPTAQVRRQNYLNTLADTGLAEQDATEQIRRERERTERADRERLAQVRERGAKLRADRFKAVAEAETAAKALREAIDRVLDAADEERTVLSELGLRTIGLGRDAVKSRLSQYLSDALRNTKRGSSSRFGVMGLARHFPQGADSWPAAEKLAMGEDRIKQNEESDQ
jgi:hypothetical protein